MSTVPRMQPGATQETISVRPQVKMLGVFQHLNYRPWYALAEFIDNSIQSYLANCDRLEAQHDGRFVLKIDVIIGDEPTRRIVIRDNAAGIASTDYQRAFRPAEPPPDTSGLSEFGMGMKSAAFWFSPKWQVRTKALGESTCATITMDLVDIVSRGTEEVTVTRITAPSHQHFTEVTLEAVRRLPQGRTLGKVRTYLADIYRVFLRDGLLELRVNGEPISFDPPKVLNAPQYDASEGAPSIEWRKPVDVSTKSGIRICGFAAILATGSASGAGFALLRRDRLIQGLSEEGWKPDQIFGRPNSFRSQRVFGELFIEGVPVSHTKDGFRLEDHEEEIVALLKETLDADPMPLLRQAENMRFRVPKVDLAAIATAGVNSAITAVENRGGPALAQADGRSVALDAPTPTGTQVAESNDGVAAATPTLVARRESRDIVVGTEVWKVSIELTDDAAMTEWILIFESSDARARTVSVRFSIVHPFIQRFVTEDGTALEPLIRMACALALSQVAARKAGVAKAGAIVMNVNHLLREVLCHD